MRRARRRRRRRRRTPSPFNLWWWWKAGPSKERDNRDRERAGISDIQRIWQMYRAPWPFQSAAKRPES
eukprot:9004297-Pyramimonas_sp.AAC.1